MTAASSAEVEHSPALSPASRPIISVELSEPNSPSARGGPLAAPRPGQGPYAAHGSCPAAGTEMKEGDMPWAHSWSTLSLLQGHAQCSLAPGRVDKRCHRMRVPMISISPHQGQTELAFTSGFFRRDSGNLRSYGIHPESLRPGDAETAQDPGVSTALAEGGGFPGQGRCQARTCVHMHVHAQAHAHHAHRQSGDPVPRTGVSASPSGPPPSRPVCSLRLLGPVSFWKGARVF